jgi:hypothetical protein
MVSRIRLASQKSKKSAVTWLPWPSRIRRRHRRRALAVVRRLNTCSSQASLRLLFDQPVGELEKKT